MGFFIKNYGNTPASNFYWFAVLEAVPNPLPVNFAFRDGDTSGEQDALFPQQISYVTKHTDRPLRLDEMLKVISGADNVIFYGTLHYKDIFGGVYYTNFCITFNAPSGALGDNCERHNDAS